MVPQVDDRGATVKRVVEGSPAEAAGIEPGDVLLSIDGEPFPTGPMRAIIDTVSRFRAGDEIEIAFRRDDEVKTARLTLAEVPPASREVQERTRAIEARAEEHVVFGRFLDSVSAFDVTLSESGDILYKKPDETRWTTLGDAPAESLRPVVEQTLAEQGQEIVRLKIERSDGGSMRWIAVPRER